MTFWCSRIRPKYFNISKLPPQKIHLKYFAISRFEKFNSNVLNILNRKTFASLGSENLVQIFWHFKARKIQVKYFDILDFEKSNLNFDFAKHGKSNLNILMKFNSLTLWNSKNTVHKFWHYWSSKNAIWRILIFDALNNQLKYLDISKLETISIFRLSKSSKNSI